MRGDYNFLHLFHDLHGLDPELYRNLMFLKTYDGGDVEDLCLTFSVADEEFGANKEASVFLERLIRAGGRLCRILLFCCCFSCFLVAPSSVGCIKSTFISPRVLTVCFGCHSRK